MNVDDAILVAGSTTLTGKALVRHLNTEGYRNVVEDPPGIDFRDPHQVNELYERERPDYVFIVAGTSGGIDWNRRYPADLIVDNLRIETNLIEGAYRVGVKKLLFSASSCCYPRNCEQPMKESALWDGAVEPTSEAYATAKRAGIMLCQAFRQQHGARFIPVIPATPYGSGSVGDPAQEHVVSALLARITEAHESGAAQVEVWGTGNPVREFIHADDLASAYAHIMKVYEGDGPLNVGVGVGHTIRELAETIASVVDYEGTLRLDVAKPDGAPEKVLDSSELFDTGWRPRVSLREGLDRAANVTVVASK